MVQRGQVVQQFSKLCLLNNKPFSKLRQLNFLADIVFLFVGSHIPSPDLQQSPAL